MAAAANGPPSVSGDEQPPSIALVEAVSERAGTPVAQLPPLYDVVDPDALDALFAKSETFGAVTFEYAGYDVTIRADQAIDVSPIE